MTVPDVPLIDVGALEGGSQEAKAALVDKLMRAATEIGFLQASDAAQHTSDGTQSFLIRAGKLKDGPQLTPAKDAVSIQLRAALQVVNHSIDRALIDAMFAQSAGFFALPLEAKQRCAHDSARNVGFESFSQIRPSTGLPDNKESLQMAHQGMEGKFPSDADCPGFETTAVEFQRQCHGLAMKLLACLATGLGLEPDFFEKHHDVSQTDAQCTLRCLHYPATGADVPRGAWRAGSHTDFDTLTLLFQLLCSIDAHRAYMAARTQMHAEIRITVQRVGQGGLEVCPGRKAVTEYGGGDTWTPVEPCENAVTINIGDLLMRWSDDRLKSNYHRVRMPPPEEASRPRFSIAYFAQPNRSSLVQGRLKKYPPITAGDYIAQASKPQFEAKKLWAEALEEARRTGSQPGPVKVITAQAALIA